MGAWSDNRKAKGSSGDRITSSSLPPPRPSMKDKNGVSQVECDIARGTNLLLALLASTLVLLVGAGDTERLVSLEALLLLGDLAGLLRSECCGEGKGLAGGLGLEVIGLSPNYITTRARYGSTYRGVALLGLLRVAGEDNQALLVRLQPLNVEVLALDRQVPPAVVDDDANTARLLAADAGLLELGKREATALAQLDVVAHGLATDSRAEDIKGANAKGSGLLFARNAAALLAPRLVKPGLDAALPVLAEMVVVED